MKNIAYDESYLNYRNQFNEIFNNNYFQEENKIQLDFGYVLIKKIYSGKPKEYNMTSSLCELKAPDGNILFRYNNLNTDGDFQKIILHSNGHMYFIYRQDLYGYSVFDIDNNKTFDYFPEKSLRGEETFIWTDVFYNEINNYLAVSGCYWASPYSIMLVDFTNPMLENSKWFDVMKHIDGGYGENDGLEFERWSGKDLIVKAENIFVGSKLIEISDYNNW